MKKILLSLVALSSMTISACGQFTNFPAQYHIAGNSNLVATVSYPPSGATGSGVVVNLPRLVIKGEPGSVGVTFNQMDISYNTPDITASKTEVTVRVDSSHFRDNNGNVIVDGGSAELPIISPKVIDYGKRQNASNITAKVTLSGSDDAGWPTELTANVAIVFVPGGTASAPTAPTTPTTP
ncbi:MAG: hypothetical protein U0354_01055 [Candidatus Sericytochromatia bacterium]